MATSWDELIQEIKDRLDIVEVISKEVVLKKLPQILLKIQKLILAGECGTLYVYSE